MTMTEADYALPLLSQPIQQPGMTGRLKHFQANWRKITNDRWILQPTIYHLSNAKHIGYHIPFIKRKFGHE